MICSTKVSHDMKSQVVQHVATSKHQERLKRTAKQTLFKSGYQAAPSDFAFDLCDAFTSSDIPLYKLKNPKLRTFIEKYTGLSVPDESTLRKQHLPR